MIKDLFGIAKDTKSLLKDIGAARQKTKGTVNKILAETEFNMDLILTHYHRNNIPAEKIISRLRIEHLAKALDEGFDFTKIRKGKITPEMIKQAGALKTYAGHDCEMLLKKIRKHIEAIQLLPELYDLETETQVNIKTRLENLGKRYLLFVKFLESE